MSEETKRKLESLESIIDNFPVPKEALKVFRKVIELRTILEISEAFKAREKKILTSVFADIENIERNDHNE